MKAIELKTPTIEYIGCDIWTVGKEYPGDPKRRVIASIEKIQKTGEMAYVDWFAIKDDKGNLIGEVRAGCLESILYDEKKE